MHSRMACQAGSPRSVGQNAAVALREQRCGVVDKNKALANHVVESGQAHLKLTSPPRDRPIAAEIGSGRQMVHKWSGAVRPSDVRVGARPLPSGRGKPICWSCRSASCFSNTSSLGLSNWIGSSLDRRLIPPMCAYFPASVADQ
jgi:hypothetical protein